MRLSAFHEPARTDQRRFVKVGRNDPCPCGSGKKYKKCCIGTANDPAIYAGQPGAPGPGPLLASEPWRLIHLKVTLLGTEPPIWRRLVLSGSHPLSHLHYAIQEAMGWWDAHLHVFRIGGRAYSAPDMQVSGARDSRRTWLHQVLHEGMGFIYQYDFGDSWEHEIVVEKVVGTSEKFQETRCPGGARACPPENCGGVWAYAHLLEAFVNPDDPDHEEAKERLGEDFDPEAFDADSVNRRLI